MSDRRTWIKRLGGTLGLVIAAVVILGGRAAAADAVTTTIVGADRDSHLRLVPRDWANLSTNTRAIVGKNFYAQVYRMVIAFDLSKIPAGSRVTRATLLLKPASQHGIATNSPGMKIAAHRLLREWEGRAVTCEQRTASRSWAERGADRAGVDRADTPTAVALTTRDRGQVLPGFLGWDVTADVQAFVSGKTPNHGWLLIAESEADRVSLGVVVFHSSEGDEADAPRLQITYVPGPAVPRSGRRGQPGPSHFGMQQTGRDQRPRIVNKQAREETPCRSIS